MAGQNKSGLERCVSALVPMNWTNREYAKLGLVGRRLPWPEVDMPKPFRIGLTVVSPLWVGPGALWCYLGHKISHLGHLNEIERAVQTAKYGGDFRLPQAAPPSQPTEHRQPQLTARTKLWADLGNLDPTKLPPADLTKAFGFDSTPSPVAPRNNAKAGSQLGDPNRWGGLQSVGSLSGSSFSLLGNSPLRDFGVKLGLESVRQDAWHNPWRGPSSRLSLGSPGGGFLNNLWNTGNGAFSPAGGRLRLGLSNSPFGGSNRSSGGSLSNLWDAGNSYRPPTSSLLDNSLSLRDIGTKLSLGSLRQDAWHSPWRSPSSGLSLGGSGGGSLSNLWNAGSSFSSAGPPSIRLSTSPSLTSGNWGSPFSQGFNTPAWQSAGSLGGGSSLSSFARGL